MISICILTKNEEQDLPGCLASVAWSDDVHVMDSFSDDSTVEVAKAAGATVTQRRFDNYAAQRNAALNEIGYKYPWILILDADERVPSQLVSILGDGVRNAADGVDGFRLRRRDYLGSSWLKHAQLSPFYIRLVRKGKAWYHREINEVIEVEGRVEDLPGYFEHYPFSKGVSYWLQKHNQYSTMEAQRWIDESNGAVNFSLKKALFAKDFNVKRFHQKGLFYKIPGRPMIKWLYMMFVRLAFLDGSAGIRYANLQAIYEYFIVLKTKEKIRASRTRQP